MEERGIPNAAHRRRSAGVANSRAKNLERRWIVHILDEALHKCWNVHPGIAFSGDDQPVCGVLRMALRPSTQSGVVHAGGGRVIPRATRGAISRRTSGVAVAESNRWRGVDDKSVCEVGPAVRVDIQLDVTSLEHERAELHEHTVHGRGTRTSLKPRDCRARRRGALRQDVVAVHPRQTLDEPAPHARGQGARESGQRRDDIRGGGGGRGEGGAGRVNNNEHTNKKTQHEQRQR
mmetsp:Transcript_5367/g.13964  ORF Transcript_5367/g.13964 Transcript_5367/m.13964 type:complete len:234 (+) Transcript_5367:926-1627(+)